MRELIEHCSRELRAGATILAADLEQFGFTFSLEYAGSSSSGPFANGFFDSERLRIGLIVRQKRGLGSVNYESGEYQCAHNELLSSLGIADRSRVYYDNGSMSTSARDGGDPFTALAYDLRELFLPIWVAQPALVESAIRVLRERWLSELRIALPKPD